MLQDHCTKYVVTLLTALWVVILCVFVCGGCPSGDDDDTTQDDWLYSFEPNLDLSLAMSDGTTLMTDVYAPEQGTSWPVLMMRTPYDPDNECEMGQILASAGIVVVVQNSRGFYGSSGDRDFFGHDRSDGRDMISLLTHQTWCNGKILQWGFSAPGIETYLALPPIQPGDPIHLAAIPGIATADLYLSVIQNGVFRSYMFEEWLKSTDQADMIAKIRSNMENESWWSERRISNRYNQVYSPVFHVTGWFDIFTDKTIEAFREMSAAGSPGQYLLIGPWTHGGLDNPIQGELIFPENSVIGYDSYLLAWMAYYLLDEGTLDDWSPVLYYTMGNVDAPSSPGNEWAVANQWPPFEPELVTVYLRESGVLSPEPPAAAEGGSTYQYDPTNPAPTVGGPNLMLPAGPHDQRAVEARSDVLCWTTDVLASPVEVTGSIKATIYLQTDVIDTDIVVRVCDVYPDGRSMNITDQILRTRYRDGQFPEATFMTPGTIYALDLELWPTSIVFDTDHRIRVLVTSSTWPRFDANPNTGGQSAGTSDAITATTTIFHSSATPSQLVLPVRWR